MKYRIAICDDDSVDRDYVSAVVEEWSASYGHVVLKESFPSAEAFLFQYEERKDYDILLLDIEMKDISGVELARKLRGENTWTQIIFITGYQDFMAEGYEVSALHYLMKPVGKEKLFEVLNRAAAGLDKKSRSVMFQVDGATCRVDVEDIIYVEAFSHSMTVHTVAEELEVKMSMSEAEKLLGEGFVRCHRSYIAGLKHVARITRTEVILDRGVSIPLARNSYAAVNQAFIRYYRE